MDKKWLLGVEQNLSEKQMEIERMQMELDAQKAQLDSQTAQELAARLNTLYKEYASLKQQVSIICSNEQAYEQIKGVGAQQAETNALPNQVHIKQPVQQVQQRVADPQKNVQLQKPIQKQPKPKKDLEKTLGKSVMGVMASVLIFVALIMFAIVALPSMTDTIKMIAMFVISGGITGIGVMLMKKDQKNAFNASIAGCGIGAVFISLMTTRMYFNAINDYILYIALLIWAAAVAFFSKDKHKVFVVIAEVGISVATIIGLAGIFADNSAADIKANMLVAFALLSEIAIFYFNRTNEMKDDIFMHLPHVIRTFIMTMMFIIMSDESVISGVPLMMAAFIVIGLFMLSRSTGGKNSKNFILTSYVLPIMLAFNNFAVSIFGEAEMILPYVVFIGAALIYHAYTYIHNEYKIAVSASHLALIYCVSYFVDEIGSFDSGTIMAVILPTILLIAPVMFMAHKTKEPYWKWVGAGLPLFMAIAWVSVGINDVEVAIGVIIAIAAIITNFKLLNNEKDDPIRIVLYIASMIIMPLCVGNLIYSWETNSEVVEAILMNINMACIYVPMVLIYLYVDKKNVLTRKVDISVLQNIIMSALILMGSIALHDGANVWSFDSDSHAHVVGEFMYNIQSWLIGITMIGLNVMRTMTMLRKGKGYGVGISAAYVVSMWAIITRLSDIDYVVSIVMLLLAIGMIVLGFKIKVRDIVGNKEMRLFGLVLSMVVTVKLLMFDIEHNNLLETSGYLLLAGILCFAISFAYNRLDKSLVGEKTETTNKDVQQIEDDCSDDEWNS